MISHREHAGRFEVKTYVEGDLDVYSCEREAERDAITDYLAWFYWEHQGASWAEGHTFETAPPELFGPFSWNRLDAEGDA